MEPRWRSNYIEVYTEKWNEDYDLIAFLINTYISKLHKTLHKKGIRGNQCLVIKVKQSSNQNVGKVESKNDKCSIKTRWRRLLSSLPTLRVR